MYGIDISKHQEGIDLSKGNYDFAIVKATEGVGYVDPYFHNYVVQLTKLNKLIGCYHFARPDLRPTIEGMEQEAKEFVNAVSNEGLLNKAILVLDWEVAPLNDEKLVTAWCMKLRELTGVVPFIYSNLYNLNKWKKWDVVENSPIWVAQWKSFYRYEVGEPPREDGPTSLKWEIWQYSASGKYPGLSGDIDLDYSTLTPDMWATMAGSVPEKLSDDMLWAIENGLFVGYGDNQFKPKEPMTREQAATLLRRFANFLNK